MQVFLFSEISFLLGLSFVSSGDPWVFSWICPQFDSLGPVACGVLMIREGGGPWAQHGTEAFFLQLYTELNSSLVERRCQNHTSAWWSSLD